VLFVNIANLLLRLFVLKYIDAKGAVRPFAKNLLLFKEKEEL